MGNCISYLLNANSYPLIPKAIGIVLCTILYAHLLYLARLNHYMPQVVQLALVSGKFRACYVLIGVQLGLLIDYRAAQSQVNYSYP